MFLDSVSFGKMALEACQAEIDKWLGYFNDRIEGSADTVERSIHQGWLTHKDSFLYPERQQVAKGLLSNI